MKHLFDDVTHHHHGCNEDRAEDKFVDKLKHLTETTWGLKKKKCIEKVADGVKRTSKNGKQKHKNNKIKNLKNRQKGATANRSRPYKALDSLKHQIRPLLPVTDTGKKRAYLAKVETYNKMIKNETSTISLSTPSVGNSIKKQTIDNSLVTSNAVDQEEPTAKNDGTNNNNNINQELTNIIRSSESSSQGQSSDSIHDNSLLADNQQQRNVHNFI